MRTHARAEGCGSSSRADAGDQVFRLVIETAGRYAITLDDFDLGASIDTVVYLRNSCEDATSQIACSDDTPCTGGVGCVSGTDFGRSRIVVNLEPGVYYVVVDAFLSNHSGREWTCGDVRLSVTPTDGAPLPGG